MPDAKLVKAKDHMIDAHSILGKNMHALAKSKREYNIADVAHKVAEGMQTAAASK